MSRSLKLLLFFLVIIGIIVFLNTYPAHRKTQRLRELQLAAQNGELHQVAELLKKGADPNAKDHDGRTPLQLAVQNGHNGTAQILVQFGADLWLRDTNAIIDALNYHQTQMAQEMYAIKDIAKTAAASASLKRDSQGRTALHRAAAAGDMDKVAELIKQGVSPNVQDQDGRTPLHLAAQNGHNGTVQFLLKDGANPWVREWTDGSLAVDFARRGGHTQTAQEFDSTKLPEVSDMNFPPPPQPAVTYILPLIPWGILLMFVLILAGGLLLILRSLLRGHRKNQTLSGDEGSIIERLDGMAQKMEDRIANLETILSPAPQAASSGKTGAAEE